MLSLREPARHPLSRFLARVLILALVAGLLPVDASASVTAPPGVPRALPELASQPVADAVVVWVVVVGDPVWLTKDAFGQLLSHTGTDPQPYLFAGEPYDPNVRMAYHRARWMEPRTGRFGSMDPLQDSHAYLYSSNDAINRVDPTGLFAEFTMAVSILPTLMVQSVPGVVAGGAAVAGTRRPSVELTLTATISGWALTFPYPDYDPATVRSNLYKVPTYSLIVSGTNGNGTRHAKTFEVIRFGVNKNAGSPEIRTVGLAEERTYALRWYGGYRLHSSASADDGGWIITGNHLIHDGADDPQNPDSQLVASLGCVEVLHAGKWGEFNRLIRDLAGVPGRLSLDEALGQVTPRLTVRSAGRPPLQRAP